MIDLLARSWKLIIWNFYDDYHINKQKHCSNVEPHHAASNLDRVSIMTSLADDNFKESN